MPPWLLFVILIVVILIIIWILISGNPKEETPELAPKAEPAMDMETSDEGETVVEAVAPDDLKKIEGIGPKIAGILAEHGILTFRQLSETNVENLQTILDEAEIRIANPTTWPEQAALAADGNWNDLETLQDSLKGGRRE